MSYETKEHARVMELRAKAKKRPHLTQSTEKLDKRWKRRNVISLNPGMNVGGFSNAIAAGDAIVKKIKDFEYIRAQHGPIKVIMKDGKYVEQPPK